MMRRDPELEPELEAFLQRRPIQRHVPPELRARALARGRATIAGRGASPAVPFLPLPATPPVRVSTGHVNAGRYNEIWFEDRLLHGQVTAKELNTASHGVNDPVYGPSRAYRNDGRLMVRGPAGWIQQK